MPSARVDVDIVCVGFGPAMAGFLTTISAPSERGRRLHRVLRAPGMPPQVICCERADDIGFGVSGVVTRGRAIRASFPDFDPSQIPMAAPVAAEKLVYLLDPVGASRRSLPLRTADRLLRILRPLLPFRHSALRDSLDSRLPAKHDGFVLSLGQFTQWVAGQVMAAGNVQIWPGFSGRRAAAGEWPGDGDSAHGSGHRSRGSS